MISYMVVDGEIISSQEEGVMKESTKDGWLSMERVRPIIRRAIARAWGEQESANGKGV